MKLTKWILACCLLINLCVWAAPITHPVVWPGGISPTAVYKVVYELNQYADAFLKGRDIKSWQALPTLTDQISPMVVFQQSLAAVEIVHDYELRQGRRPIPIMTSSPIYYYPADVYYVCSLLLERMQDIAKQKSVKVNIDDKLIANKTFTSEQVYQQLLNFYMKLAALNQVDQLGADEVYVQMHRANQELKTIILFYVTQLKDVKEIRSLAAATYGTDPYGGEALSNAPATVTPLDVYRKTIVVRELLREVLKQNGLTPLKFSNQIPDKVSPINNFIQSQIIIGELGEWKRKLDIGTSSPVTDQVDGMTQRDVMQEVLSLEYMLKRLKDAQA